MLRIWNAWEDLLVWRIKFLWFITALHCHLPKQCRKNQKVTQPVFFPWGDLTLPKALMSCWKPVRSSKERGVDFQLTLAGGRWQSHGSGETWKKLHKLRHDLGLENEVFMPGLISRDQLPEILIEHDIFAAPCVIHSSGRRDGIPNTVSEAMAYGLPVAATDVNALPEVVVNGKTGLIVPPGDPNALADALGWLIDNPCRARGNGRRG